MGHVTFKGIHINLCIYTYILHIDDMAEGSHWSYGLFRMYMGLGEVLLRRTLVEAFHVLSSTFKLLISRESP